MTDQQVVAFLAGPAVRLESSLCLETSHRAQSVRTN